ncbi:MAG: sialidase family protein [Bacteroidaceae bacterium]
MRKTVSLLLLGCCAITGWAQERSNLPWVDLSAQKARQVVIAKGTPELYNGHPTSVLLEDQKTILCTWSFGHGGRAAFLGESKDAGRSWSVRKTPADWSTMIDCPSLYRLTDKMGKERLFVFCGSPKMGQSYSEDGGQTWSAVRSLGKPCVMAFASIVKLDNGDYLGLYHRGLNDQDRSPLTLWKSVSHDGGLTWDESVMVGKMEGRSPCEPCVFRVPKGKRLVCLARENDRVGNSLMMFSDDEGVHWTPLQETPWGLTGDRHVVKFTPDGRMVAVFRDMAPQSPTKGHFVAWVGHYKDLREGTSGQYKIKLLHSYAGSDCGYPGLEILPDGTILAITYIKNHPGKEQHSIVEVRFKLEETDLML